MAAVLVEQILSSMLLMLPNARPEMIPAIK